jgi:hypothetical protein
MRRLTLLLLAAAAAAVACSKQPTAPDPDAIAQLEMAAVRSSLDTALKNDSNYQTLRLFVFQFVDRASHVPDPANGADTRVVGIQLDINAAKGGVPVVTQLSGVLAWRGYSATTHTVDSVTFVIGTGLNPPVSDTLQRSFSPANSGEGTGFIIHEAPDSVVTAWQARTGALHVTSASYGSGQTTSGGGLSLTVYRGTLAGDYHIGALSVPDSTTSNKSTASFPTGVRAVKIGITGSIP